MDSEIQQTSKNGVTFFVVDNPQEGFEKAKKIMYQTLNPQWVLFLSGGTTPKPMYEQMAKDYHLNCGSVALVDERYGDPFHQNSNELMLKNSGLLDYFAEEYIQFYSILSEDKDREEIAAEYDGTVGILFAKFKERFALLGIGRDGHVAGVAPNRADFTDPIFEQNDLLVGEFSDPKLMPEGFGERITLTLNALSQMTALMFLVFGEEKRKALEQMFVPGPIEQCPARFVLAPEIAKKTLVITDIKL